MDIETLTEFTDNRGLAITADTPGVLKNVKILGAKSRNGREYPESTMVKAVALYESARVNVDHASKPGDPRSYAARIGQITNVRALRDGLYGDLHYNPKHALAEQLAWDAENAPENVGFSHNVQAKTSRRGDTVVVEEITRVQSVDLVADPATTRGLFEATETDVEEADDMAEKHAEGGQVLDLTEAYLQQNHPQIVEAIVKRTLEEHAASAEQKAILKERDTLKEKLAKLEEQAKQTKKREAVLKLCEEAKLEKPSDTFVEACLALDTVEKQKELIQERVEATPSKGQPSKKPVSRDQNAPQLGTPANGVEGFVEAITALGG